MGVDHDSSTVYCWSSSGNDVHWLCLIISSTMAVGDWCISILAVVVNDWKILILIVLTDCCLIVGISIPWFYCTFKGYQRLFTFPCSNKAYGLFSSLTQPLDHT